MFPIEDMDLDQFITWASGLIIIRLGSGEKLKSTVWEIMNNFLLRWLPAHGWIHEDKPRAKKGSKK